MIVVSIVLLVDSVLMANSSRDSVGDLRRGVKVNMPFRETYDLANEIEEELQIVQDKIFLGSSILILLTLLPWAKPKQTNQTEQASGGNGGQCP